MKCRWSQPGCIFVSCLRDLTLWCEIDWLLRWPRICCECPGRGCWLEPRVLERLGPSVRFYAALPPPAISKSWITLLKVLGRLNLLKPLLPRGCAGL